MIDADALNRLIALGRAKGGLDTQDIRRALPVAQMAPEDIALILLQIEEAGVPVDVEDALLAGEAGRADRASAAPGAAPPPVIDLPGAASAHASALAATATGAWPGPSDAAPAAARLPPQRAVHWAVGAAALLLVLISIALFVTFR